MSCPARAGRAPEDAVGGPPGGTEGELGGLGGGDLDEILFRRGVEFAGGGSQTREGRRSIYRCNSSSCDTLMSALDQQEEGVLN